MTVYALFFASLKRRVGRKSIGLTLFFERKIYDFPFKKQRRSDRFPPRTPFERSEKQCVTYHEMFRINFVSLLKTIMHYQAASAMPPLSRRARTSKNVRESFVSNCWYKISLARNNCALTVPSGKFISCAISS